jgi:type I pantothenate kinase
MSMQAQVLELEPPQAPDPRQAFDLSPYRTFTRSQWAELRNGVHLTLSEEDLARLSGLIERISQDEVTDVYLPVSKLVNYYVRAAQLLHSATSKFFARGEEAKMPFVLGIAGSVAAGKSTSARVLRELLARWPAHQRVDLVSTDGFLWPNAELERRGIMHRKGFPESFDQSRLLQFVADVKAGRSHVEAPVYSHFSYDIVPGGKIVVDRPDILIVEGLNVLQPAKLPKHGEAVPFVSDFFDFSIYIDAEPAVIENWYVTRFLRLWRTAFRDKDAYFYRYSKLTEEQAVAQALKLWRTINLVNLKKNILPTRKRANLILSKGEAHRVETVALRKL